MGEMEQWKRVALGYQFALRELENKFLILNTEWEMMHGYVPIEHIKLRIKDYQSIREKLKRKNLPLTIESAVENISDIAGMRIVCVFIRDIERLKAHLLKRNDIRITQIKDYVSSPKPNGYQSLHLIIQVPLVLSEITRWMSVEVQLRTLAMDFWASLEHILYYKFDKQVPTHVIEQLTEAALAASELDRKMLSLRKEILQSAGGKGDQKT